MVSLAISAANSATPSIQVAFGRTRLAQAQREADQAEANAKDLRAKADDAEQQAQNSQDNVQKVAQRNREDEATYSAITRSSASQVPLKVQNLIEQMYKATSEQRALSGNPIQSRSNPAPVVNTQGQATGRIVDVKA